MWCFEYRLGSYEISLWEKIEGKLWAYQVDLWIDDSKIVVRSGETYMGAKKAFEYAQTTITIHLNQSRGIKFQGG